MKIAICDDDLAFSEVFSSAVAAYCKKHHMDFSIDCYHTGGDLLNRANARWDVVFLDIHMKDMNGIDVARILRERNPGFILVFVSAHMEYAPSGYEVTAFRYLLKDRLESSLPGCLDAVRRQLDYHAFKLYFDFVNGPREIYADDILYVESVRHQVVFVMADNHQEGLRLYEKLDAIQEKLPRGEFLRIHKSYLVNCRHIERVVNYKAVLKNGTALPVSQSRYPSVRKEFFAYKGKM